jgi:hypothetical protein
MPSAFSAARERDSAPTCRIRRGESESNLPISKHAFNEGHAVAVPKDQKSLKLDVGRRLEIGVRHESSPAAEQVVEV